MVKFAVGSAALNKIILIVPSKNMVDHMVMPDNIKTILITAFVSSITLFQFYVSILPLTGKPMGGWYWPFTDYPMYKGTINEGDHIPIRTIVIARDSSGKETEITANIVGGGIGLFRFSNLAKTLINSDEEHTNIINLLTRNLDNRDNIIEIDLLNYPLVITKKGAEEAPSELLKRIHL
ncbi:MAG: hypothetical protein WCH04_22715 [Gammaproteobacteria bacterium]